MSCRSTRTHTHTHTHTHIYTQGAVYTGAGRGPLLFIYLFISFCYPVAGRRAVQMGTDY